MTIKAILREGRILPLEPLPTSWVDGQELAVEDPASATTAELAQWAAQLHAATSQLPAEEHDRFLKALEENEKSSKDAVRRESCRDLRLSP
jgi:Ser/Thr protein kinase RdoA (MazF antagonist)